jgi:MFS family permease
MSHSLFGYDQGVMGGLLTLPSFVKTFPEIDVNNTVGAVKAHASQIQGISVASYNLGCLFGAVCTIWLGDILGRRKMIFLGSAIMILGAALQCSAFSLGHLVAGRVITGIGNGMNTSTVSSCYANSPWRIGPNALDRCQHGNQRRRSRTSAASW